MRKLKDVVSQLSTHDYEALQAKLSKGGANKASFVLQALREQNLGDRKITRELDMNTNAYYTLCSRLGKKIDNYLISQIKMPHTLLFLKVANLHEVIFNSSRTIALATLQKLEKELLNYDLSAELLLVYRYLKKLSMHSADHEIYSHRYHQQISHMQLIDKSEHLLVEYFRNFGMYYLQKDEKSKAMLRLCKTKLRKLLAQHDTHRLYVHYAALNIFHRLYMDNSSHTESKNNKPIDHIFQQAYNYFEQYAEDPIYPHYVLLFDFLQLAYYHHYGIQCKVEHLYNNIAKKAPKILSHYDSYTFPSQILWITLSKELYSGTASELEARNKVLFANYKPEVQDAPNYLSYVAYRALCCYYAKEYRAAATRLQQAFNRISFKGIARAHVELKALLALQYSLLNEKDLFIQTINSIQRQLRTLGKEQLPHIRLFVKILKLSMQNYHKNKEKRMIELAQKIKTPKSCIFSPIRFVRIDEAFNKQICKT